MDALIQQAAYGKGTLPGFATKQVNLSSSEIIRGIAQCTPDIVGPGCYRCLAAALRQRDTWANTMVFLPSCLFRYELYEILTPAALSPSPPTLRGSHIAVIVVFVALAVIGSTCLCWINRQYLLGICFTAREPIAVGPIPPVVNPPVVNPRPYEFAEYEYDQVIEMTNGFHAGNILGRGGYASVYRGKLPNTSTDVAVKVLQGDDAQAQFRNEMDVSARIKHKNLVSLLGYCEDGTNLALIYEYMEKGDLGVVLSSQPTENAGVLSWTDRLNIAIDTAKGLNYMHEVLIVHRDVKPANILVSGNLRAKVADFGLSKIFPQKIHTVVTRVVYTRGYIAPEYHTTGRMNEKVDVYSFGVVLMELITGATLRPELDKRFKDLINKGDIEMILDQRVKGTNEQSTTVPNRNSVWKATELAKICLEDDATKRPTMLQILVALTECLNIEASGASSSGSTSTGIMSPMIPETVTMEPQLR